MASSASHDRVLLTPHGRTMVYAIAQSKRKADGDPIYVAPTARRRTTGKKRTNIVDLPDELLIIIFEAVGAP